MTKTTRTRLRRSGKALAFALPAIGIVALSVLVVAPNTSRASAAEPPSLEEIMPRSVLLRGDLARAGLKPEVFAAAGVSGATVSQIVGGLALDSDFGLDQFRSAWGAHLETSRAVREREREIRAGLASEAEIADLGQLRSAASASEAALGSSESSVLDLVEAVVTASQAEAIATIRANSELGVPLPYAATDLGAVDRVRLRDALSMRKYADQHGMALDAETAAFLEEIDGRPEVIAAAAGLDDLELVRSSYDGALAALDQ
ncbi:MAG: hypothetical protein Tsb0013_07380 [Phycisphaerales bacterium]